jgi:REP element-mobilizing transposase RayT
VPHVRRPQLKGAAHVVLRIRRGLPWLRTPKTWRVLERCFRSGKKKDGFRLVEFSVQQDHLHLIVEAESRIRGSVRSTV